MEGPGTPPPPLGPGPPGQGPPRDQNKLPTRPRVPPPKTRTRSPPSQRDQSPPRRDHPQPPGARDHHLDQNNPLPGGRDPPSTKTPPLQRVKALPRPPPTPDQDPPVPGPHTRSAGSRTGRSRAGRGRVPAAATEQRSRAVGPRESHPDLVGAASSSTAGPTSAPGEPRYGGHCAATWRTHAGRMSCSAQAQA